MEHSARDVAADIYQTHELSFELERELVMELLH